MSNSIKEVLYFWVIFEGGNYVSNFNFKWMKIHFLVTHISLLLNTASMSIFFI